MVTHIAAVAALVTTLALSAPAAHADTTAPTPLTLDRVSIEVSVDTPPGGEPVICDRNNHVYCGFIAINLELSGLDGRERPGPDDYPWPLSTSGTADVTRVYGCETSSGRRLHRYDTKVVERGTELINRRNIPYPVPTDDTFEGAVFGLLPDAQPGDCPRGTSPRLYRLVAKHAEITLESQWAGIPASTTYAVRGPARWDGSAPTPKA